MGFNSVFTGLMYSCTSYVVSTVNCPSSFNLDPQSTGSEHNLPAGDGTDTATRIAPSAIRTQSNRKLENFQNSCDSDSKHAR